MKKIGTPFDVDFQAFKLNDLLCREPLADGLVNWIEACTLADKVGGFVLEFSGGCIQAAHVAFVNDLISKDAAKRYCELFRNDPAYEEAKKRLQQVLSAKCHQEAMGY